MAEQTRSAVKMATILQEGDNLEKLQKAPNPKPILDKIASQAIKEVDKEPAYWSDKPFYYIVVSVLGFLAIVTAIGSVILAFGGKTTPEVLISIGSAAVGALAGLFTPSPVGKK